MRLFLIGFMGSGKTTVAKNLAAALQFSFFDLDAHIEISTGLTINQIFSSRGEPFFRMKERELLFQTRGMERVVVATGGGTPCFQANMDFMLSHGIAVYLRVDPDVLAGRLALSKTDRPLIRELDDKGIHLLIKKLLPEREPWYRKANYIVDANRMENFEVERQLLAQAKELSLFQISPGHFF